MIDFMQWLIIPGIYIASFIIYSISMKDFSTTGLKLITKAAFKVLILERLSVDSMDLMITGMLAMLLVTPFGAIYPLVYATGYLIGAIFILMGVAKLILDVVFKKYAKLNKNKSYF